MSTDNKTTRVLHVDDDRGFLELTVTFLERRRERFDVETATSASEGLDLLAEDSYDCIVSDYDMPNTNGIEFLELVREEHPELPFILFTGKGSEEVAAEALSAGATDYIQKLGSSSQYTVLANRIENAVETYRSTRRIERANRRRRRTLQRIADGFAELDDDLTYVDVNEQALEFTGYSREELIGENYRDVATGESSGEFLEAYQEVLETGESRSVVAESDIVPGHWIEERVFPSEDRDGLFSYFLDVTERVKREQELEDQRQLYSSLVEQSPNGILIVQDEEIVFVNERMESLTGWSEDELLGRPLYDIIAPASRDLVEDRYDKRVRGERPPQNYEIEIQTRSGETRVIDLHVSRTRYRGETATLGTFNDITDLKEREGDLDALRQEYETVFENVQESLFLLDVRGDGSVQFRQTNGPESAFFRRPTTALTGKSPVEAIGKQAGARLERKCRECLEHREPITYEATRERDGVVSYWETDLTPILVDGAVDGIVGASRNVTGRKQREQTLSALHDAATEISRAQRADQIYETLIETAERVLDFDFVAIDIQEDGYLVQEASSRNIDDGDYYERTSLENDDLFGVRAYNDQETILVDDLRESDTSPADSEYRSMLTVPIGEVGTFQTVSTDVGAFDDRDREFTELLVDHARVTLNQHEDRQELRERTAQLEEKNERLDQFASLVGHDLRNPLNTLELSVDLVQETGDEEHYERCQRAISRMEQLLEDLLTLAQEGQDVDEIDVVGLESVLDEVWETVDTADSEVTVEANRTLLADRSRLKQLLANLIRNAVKHGGEDVDLRVGGTADGFYVADDGKGIPAEERDKIFETGYSKAADGTGFGLAIVSDVVDGHGWELSVSESDGGGARFEITGVDRSQE